MLEHVEAVHARHSQVGEYYVVLGFARLFQAALTVLCRVDGIALAREDVEQQLAYHLLVVYHEDAGAVAFPVRDFHDEDYTETVFPYQACFTGVRSASALLTSPAGRVRIGLQCPKMCS